MKEAIVMSKAARSFRRASVTAVLSVWCGFTMAASSAVDYVCSVTVEGGERTFFLVQTDSKESARVVALRNSVRTVSGKQVPIHQVHECIARLSERFANLDDQRRYEQLEL